jgi:hypothetical protein
MAGAAHLFAEPTDNQMRHTRSTARGSTKIVAKDRFYIVSDGGHPRDRDFSLIQQ